VTGWRPKVTIDGAVLAIILAAVLAWLVLLSVIVRRIAAHTDEPVYRRLPDGRLRFEWSVAARYQAARRSPPADPVPVGDPRPGRYRAFHP
jgi:hypothetical protein